MARTTLNLKDDLFKTLTTIANRENRTTPNLIETVLLNYINEGFFVDAAEMTEIKNDPALNKSIRAGVADYKNGRGRFV